MNLLMVNNPKSRPIRFYRLMFETRILNEMLESTKPFFILKDNPADIMEDFFFSILTFNTVTRSCSLFDECVKHSHSEFITSDWLAKNF